MPELRQQTRIELQRPIEYRKHGATPRGCRSFGKPEFDGPCFEGTDVPAVGTTVECGVRLDGRRVDYLRGKIAFAWLAAAARGCRFTP